MVFYLADFKGKAKTTGNPFHRITLAEARQKEEKLVGRVVEFFAECKIDTSDLEFGDEVKPIFEQGDFLGGRPSLVGLEKIGESPLKGKLTEKEAEKHEPIRARADEDETGDIPL